MIPDNRVQLKVCSGASCKAWGSCAVSREIQRLQETGEPLQAQQVPCMNQCGGGVSVQMGAKNAVRKIKETEQVFDLLETEQAPTVAA